MERVRWWFNGKWGRARRDLIIWLGANGYELEERSGGADGRSRWLECPDLDGAQAVAERLMEQGTWRDLT